MNTTCVWPSGIAGWPFGLYVAILDTTDAKVVEYMCNSDGLRVRKETTTTGVTDYTLHGKNIVHMTNGTNSLHFYYDAQNRPAVVEFNWVPYAYVHNLQGDIIAIVDANGNKVVEYKYDAWGKPIAKTGSLASTLGTLNPFRYRGYVYDEETGLYYLRSRYFSNEKCRFVNADSHLADNNLFSYCINNPTNNLDSNGQEHLSISSEGASGFYGIFYLVVGALNSIGCEHAAAFLLHSLSPSAKTSVYTNDDSIVESIKNSNAFQTKVRSIIDEQKYGVKDSFTFPPSELDLFGALHNVDIVVDKKANMDGSVQYNIQIDDVYNYKIEKIYEQKSSIRDSIFYTLVMCLNNVAFSAQSYGIINEYNVKILFSISEVDIK